MPSGNHIKNQLLAGLAGNIKTTNMKRLLRLVFFSFLALSLPLMTSCGDDDDVDDIIDDIENQGEDMFKPDGQLTVQYGDGDPESFNAYDASFSLFSQEVIGTAHYDLSSGATFYMSLGKEFADRYAWMQFQTKEDIEQGENMNVTGVFFNDNTYNTDETEGTAYVKSVSNDKITIVFKDFRFDRISVWRVGDSTFQTMTINGEVTFALEK